MTGPCHCGAERCEINERLTAAESRATTLQAAYEHADRKSVV